MIKFSPNYETKFSGYQFCDGCATKPTKITYNPDNYNVTNDNNKKAKKIAGVAVALACAAAFGIWAVKRGKKPKVAKNYLGDLSTDTRKIVEQAQNDVKKCEVQKIVSDTNDMIAHLKKVDKNHNTMQEFYNDFWKTAEKNVA